MARGLPPSGLAVESLRKKSPERCGRGCAEASGFYAGLNPKAIRKEGRSVNRNAGEGQPPSALARIHFSCQRSLPSESEVNDWNRAEYSACSVIPQDPIFQKTSRSFQKVFSGDQRPFSSTQRAIGSRSRENSCEKALNDPGKGSTLPFAADRAEK
jgi:hypothetical protein